MSLMSKSLTGVLVVGVAVLVAVGFMRPNDALESGEKAPTFSAAGSDGKNHTLASLTAKGPAFLYFIKDGCPVNAEAVVYMNRLADAYKGKATFVGVINTDKSGYERWNKTYKSPITVLYDPDMKIIRSYKANASPWVIEVSKDGTIGQVWKGYSSKALGEIGSKLASAGGVRPVNIDLKGAPGSMTFG